MPSYISDHLNAGSPGNPPKRENYANEAEYATAMRKYRFLNPTVIKPATQPTQQITKTPPRQLGSNRVRVGGQDMSEEEYLGGGSYRDKAIAEQKRLGREGRGNDPRGGGGQRGDGSFRQTPSVPTITSTYTAPTSFPTTSTPVQRDNMADASELDRYREFVTANKDIAERVKPGQAGYEEIQAILAEKKGGPAAGAILDTMYQYDRSAEDARSLMSGTAEKPMSMEWTTDMGINARSASAPIPAEGIPQTGTQMSSGGALVGGSTTEGISRNLLGTELSGISQADYKGSFTAGAFPGIDGVKDFDGQTRLLPAEIQTPDQSGTIPVDTLYSSGNNIADALDSQRTIAFPTPEELKGNYMNRIMGRS